MKLLIANRGEIAVRIARAAADLAIPTVAVYSQCDTAARHRDVTDEALPLSGVGVKAYLACEQMIAAAQDAGCSAIHPGYGFLSERSTFAEQCIDAGLIFIGPTPSNLELFGDKAQGRALAGACGVPAVPGSAGNVSLDEARSFLAELRVSGSARGAEPAMMIKALCGGGGRGMRVVRRASEIDEAYARARSEAQAVFGSDEVLVEQLIGRARHIEVQVAVDDDGQVLIVGDRDCSLQRRNQKLIEVAPAPDLDSTTREALFAAARKMAEASDYRNLGTFEFLVSTELEHGFAFIEANARLQVEHTVTEEVTGIDLVQLQIRLAQGASLVDLGLDSTRVPRSRGFAVQCRVNSETMTAKGDVRPSGGTLRVFEVPTGPGVRTDTYGYAGYPMNSNFDSLLAKVIVQYAGAGPAAAFMGAVRRTQRALADLRIEGVATNLSFLEALLASDAVADWSVDTRLIDRQIAALMEQAQGFEREAPVEASSQNVALSAPLEQAGATIDSLDPLAVLEHGKRGAASHAVETQEFSSEAVLASAAAKGPVGTVSVVAPMQGTIVSVETAVGSKVGSSSTVFIMEAMKMEHEIRATSAGIVREIAVASGDTVYQDHPLMFLEPGTDDLDETGLVEEIDLELVRDDLREVHERHAVTLDAARPDAVAKRRATQQRTARENIDDLCDADSFTEHGQLVLTPGSGLSREEVIKKFPTDGMITGFGDINGADFAGEASRCVVMSYDYTVLAGTQGAINHPKTDRMLELAKRWRRPVVLFAEGGGGRAGTGGKREGGESTTGAGQGRSDEVYRPLDTSTFTSMARLSGLVPLIGITSRFCFAGNAALLGCCDVIIATADSSIGMGGPALIEGGGLGVFRPEEVGPMDVQAPNGVVDVAVQDEAAAVEVAKQYLSYFQGRLADWDCVDQRLLRPIVPENRLRVYDVRSVIMTLADAGSVLELRPTFGPGMITAFARVEGRPIGILANNPQHLSGAIDSPGADKAARFMQLCDAFDLPIVVLCDTPGMMVGPEIERTALVRHCSRLFVTGANVTVPMLTIVLRKAYGLGAQAMVGGDFKVPMFTVAWPTGEFGGMGIEGQVKLGFRNELAAIDDRAERATRYQELVDSAYERGRALNAGASFAVDDVIDPADSRRWISGALGSVPDPPKRDGKKRANIDTW